MLQALSTTIHIRADAKPERGLDLELVGLGADHNFSAVSLSSSPKRIVDIGMSALSLTAHKAAADPRELVARPIMMTEGSKVLGSYGMKARGVRSLSLSSVWE